MGDFFDDEYIAKPKKAPKPKPVKVPSRPKKAQRPTPGKKVIPKSQSEIEIDNAIAVFRAEGMID